jgi:hypothetical protein
MEGSPSKSLPGQEKKNTLIGNPVNQTNYHRAHREGVTPSFSNTLFIKNPLIAICGLGGILFNTKKNA